MCEYRSRTKTHVKIPDGLNVEQADVVFDWGMCWFKGQHIATGQCNVKAYNRQLRDLIHAGRAKPSFIVSHEIELSNAREAYSTSTRATTAGRK
jgi:threonine dehydrogenase-like Zn-dependent dehydrogenase